MADYDAWKERIEAGDVEAVPREVKDGVHRLAAQQHRAESDIVREAIARYLDEAQQERRRA